MRMRAPARIRRYTLSPAYAYACPWQRLRLLIRRYALSVFGRLCVCVPLRVLAPGATRLVYLAAYAYAGPCAHIRRYALNEQSPRQGGVREGREERGSTQWL